MNINERMYLKSYNSYKYESLKNWDSIRIPILKALERTNKDFVLVKEKYYGDKCKQ